MKKEQFLFFISGMIFILIMCMSCKSDIKKVVSKNKQKDMTAHFKDFEEAQLSSGNLMRMDSFPSENITPRPVDVWLPENYSNTSQYSVLYKHDGQMLFDSTSTWNKQEWKVDEWASQLMANNKTDQFIVVAIHNISELRWFDLFPQKAAEYVEDEVLDSLRSMKSSPENRTKLSGNNYLKFIIEELKPIVDSEFSVYADKEHTYIMGSSMGGLMSMYAICEYPEVFAGAACLSTHWSGITPVGDYPLPEAIFKYMEANLPDTDTHKIYFDYGTETLDAHYPKYARTVDQILMDKRYYKGNFKNLKFDGTDHSENSWNKRLDIPLTFLLDKE